MDGSHHAHPQLHPLHPGGGANSAFMQQQPQGTWGAAGGRGVGNPNAGFGGGGALPGPQQGQQGGQQGPAMGVSRGSGSESGVGPAGLGAMPAGQNRWRTLRKDNFGILCWKNVPAFALEGLANSRLHIVVGILPRGGERKQNAPSASNTPIGGIVHSLGGRARGCIPIVPLCGFRPCLVVRACGIFVRATRWLRLPGSADGGSLPLHRRACGFPAGGRRRDGRAAATSTTAAAAPAAPAAAPASRVGCRTRAGDDGGRRHDFRLPLPW